MVSREYMESHVAEVIAGQGLVLEARLPQAKDFVEQLDAKTACVNAKADGLAAAAISAHERISVIVNDMNVAKTAIELKFGEVQGEITAELDKRQADLSTTFEQIKDAFDEIRAAARAEFTDIRATAGAEVQAQRGHIEL